MDVPSGRNGEGFMNLGRPAFVPAHPGEPLLPAFLRVISGDVPAISSDSTSRKETCHVKESRVKVINVESKFLSDGGKRSASQNTS